MRLISAVCILLLTACSQAVPTLIHGNTMGTTYSVKIVGEGREIDEAKLKAQIDLKLQGINALMSTYISDSEISKFNQAPLNQAFTLSPENIEIFAKAKTIFDLSGGLFDITVGPLVNLWGFGPDPAKDALPSAEEIKASLEKIGMKHLQIAGNQASKNVDIYVDLSAIAKGYGVDQIALLLEAQGIDNYLVEIGGELRCHGLNHQGNVWRIAIEKPDVSQRIPFRTIKLHNMAMATSGDYRNYFEVDKRRYSHTINPLTGMPITHKLASVTVLADETAMADGFATAINVMGAKAGLALAEQNNLAVLLILKTEDGFEEQYSSQFAAILASQSE